MKKDYKIFLCENKYELTEKQELKSISNRRVCEIGSANSKTSGQAYDVTFKTNINGTHELSFSIPRYSFDEDTGSNSLNPLVELVVNKSYLELIFNEGLENEKVYFFVVNEREDRDEDDVISYSYSCSDAYIEELSKTGYGLNFSNEVDGNGFGTIHELAEQVVKGTDWKYEKEKTGTLFEYTTDVKYNETQKRYDETNKLVPVHPVKFIPEVEQYCYELEIFRPIGEKYQRFYCYDTTEQVSNTTVRNILYNSKDFLDVSGWTYYTSNAQQSFTAPAGSLIADKVTKKDDAGNETNEYLLKLKSFTSDQWSYLLNTTAAANNTILKAQTPYLFNYNIFKEDNSIEDYSIVNLRIYDRNPYQFAGSNIEPIYESKGTPGASWVKSGEYGCFKLSQSVTNPYFVFGLGNLGQDQVIKFKDFSIFEVKGHTEEETLALYSVCADGKVLEEFTDQYQTPAKPDNFQVFTQKETKYFTRDNYYYEKIDGIWEEKSSQGGSLVDEEDDKVTYYEFKDVNNEKNFVLKNGEMIAHVPLKVISSDNFPTENIDTSLIYSIKGKYYQYYHLERESDGAVGDDWDYALLGSGANDKRRTLSIEKSNRYNILQELCNLFKVWIIFEVKRGENDKLEKSFYFKENCIKENFSGFHKGVNLFSFSRNMISDEIVTKMYVEDQENSYTEDGFVTIRRTSRNLNPMRENYIYNFSYYKNNKLLNESLIDTDLKNLIEYVGNCNNTILDLTDKNSSLAIDISTLNSTLKSLSTCISSATERETSRQADYENYRDNMSTEDLEAIKRDLDRYAKIKIQYEKQKAEIENKLNGINGIQVQYNANQDLITLNQTNKEKAIKDFETKYSQYIKEGVWSDSSYVDNDTYYIDAEKVSKTSSIPKTEWSITVLDGSISEELQDYQFEVGDQTILVDNDFFGVENDAENNYTFQVLISEIEEKLDNPVENRITVRNYLTSFEDLYERVSAATQTLELNEQTYNKAAYFTNDGQIDKDILQATLEKNQLVLANASDNSYSLDSNGLQFQSLLNPAKKIRILADGIFLSNSSSKGEVEWKTGITADGINASLITSGEIDTAKIKIFSGGSPSFLWDSLGITAYKNKYELEKGQLVKKTDDQGFIRFDQFGLYFVESMVNGKEDFFYNGDGIPWWKTHLNKDNGPEEHIQKNSKFSLTKLGLNLRFSSKDINGNLAGEIRLGYGQNGTDIDYSRYGLYITNGTNERVVALQSNGKNEIAGWKIEKDRISWENKENGANQSFLITPGKSNLDYLGVSGESALIKYWDEKQGGTVFGVSTSGKLYARNADIAGKITATKGEIGGWLIQSIGLIKNWGNNNEIGIRSDEGYPSVGNLPAGHNYCLYFYKGNEGFNFAVGTDGFIYARSGLIGDCQIKNGRLFVPAANISDLTTAVANIGNLNCSRINGVPAYQYLNSGVVNYIIANSGTVGGWNINSGSIYNNGVSLLTGTNPGLEAVAGLNNRYSCKVGILKTINKVPGSPLVNNTINIPGIYFKCNNWSFELYAIEMTTSSEAHLYVLRKSPDGQATSVRII